MVHPRTRDRLLLCYSYWNDSSYHESTSRSQRYYRVDHWIRPSWTPRRDDDVQDLGLHYHGPRSALSSSLVHSYLFHVWYFLALTFASDFKLGHYMKIPPRAMFWAQVVATVIAGTVQLGVQAWMFTNIPDMCSPDQKDGFICPSTEVFGTASIIWGVIGPARQFSKGQVYYGRLDSSDLIFS